MVRTCPVTNDAASEHEEDRRPDDVAGLADAAQRDAVDDVRLERRVLEQHRDLRRVDERRHDRVDPDAVLGPFGCPLPGQRADGALGRNVGRIAGVDAEVGSDRRDVQHDAALAGLDHPASDRLRRDDGAADVELHDPVPRLARVGLGGVELLAGAAADGVDDDVDAAELGDDLVHHAVALGLVRHVGRDGGSARAGCLDPGDGRVEWLAGPAGNGDRAARCGEGLRQRRPDPAAATGHERDASVEAEHVERRHRDSLGGSARRRIV